MATGPNRKEAPHWLDFSKGATAYWSLPTSLHAVSHVRRGYRSCHQLRYAGGGGELHPSSRSYRPRRRQRCRIHDFFLRDQRSEIRQLERTLGIKIDRMPIEASHHQRSGQNRLAAPMEPIEPEFRRLRASDRAGRARPSSSRKFGGRTAAHPHPIDAAPRSRMARSAWRSVTDSSRRIVPSKGSVEGWFGRRIVRSKNSSVENSSVEK